MNTSPDSDISLFSGHDYDSGHDYRLLSGGSEHMTPEEKIEYEAEMSSEFEIFVIFFLLFLG